MSFTREYKPLFQLKVSSGEPVSGLKGLSFLPTKICRERLADYQLLFRPRESGFAVFYQSNPDAEQPILAEISSRAQFDFAIHVADSQLADLFPVPEDDSFGSQLFFDNLSVSNEIEISDNTGSEVRLTFADRVSIDDSTSIFAEVFNQEIIRDDNPGKLLIKTRFNNHPLLEIDLLKPEFVDSNMIKVDLSDMKQGAYLLLTDAVEAKVIPVYIDQQLNHAAAKGVVNIYLEQAQDQYSEDGATFTITF